jgi:uncharacterized membrane protein HdeD (DUF308 family)|tara:strand:- start:3713 stop:4078 length:366 start_codon:yes stop_codon:yes gene_type:complete
MQRSTYISGIILLILGPISYFGSGTNSLSAFIPSIFGLALIICGYISNNERFRQHAIHAALTIALVGIAGIAPMFFSDLPDFIKGEAERPWAVFASLVTFITLTYFMYTGIQSFRTARKNR